MSSSFWFKDRSDQEIAHWDEAAERVGILAESLDPSNRRAVDMVFTGDCWTDTNLATFKERLRVQGIEHIMNIVNEVRQPDMFAASKRVARWKRHHLDMWNVCYMVSDDPAHDEFRRWLLLETVDHQTFVAH